MAKFLNTSATTYYLEELIKNARERLFLISPYLKLSDRIKELLEDKNRMKIDIRVVYGKSELKPAEVTWLKSLNYVRTSYCHNLHAKCYINEESCIITSLNLYEFSQVNNNEMGVLLNRHEDGSVYQDAYEEAQRIIRISEEVKMSLDVVHNEENSEDAAAEQGEDTHEDDKTQNGFLSVKQLAEKLEIDRVECNKRLCNHDLQELKGNKYFLTEKGKAAGAILKKGKFGWFILWPETLALTAN